MNQSIILGIIQNIAILLAFSMIYDYSWVKDEESQSNLKKIITGLILGTLSLVLMLTPWTLVPGIVFDTRSVLLSVSGLFFGWIPTLIAMLMAGLYRYNLGGDGVWMGLAVIFSSGLIGILWKQFRPFWKGENYPFELLGMGILVHAVMLACTALLPASQFLRTFAQIVLPIIFLYPTSTMLLGILMIKQYKNWKIRLAQENLNEMERRFTEMLKNVNLFSVILDNEGNITFCNDYLLLKTEYQSEEVMQKNWFDLFIPKERYEETKNMFNSFIIQKNSHLFTHIENEILTKSGIPVLIAWTNTLLKDRNGKIIGTASIGENITARRQAEDQKLMFAHIIESSLNEIYLFDAVNLNFNYVNYGALQNLGYSLEEIYSLSPLDILADNNLKSFQEMVSPLFLGKESIIVAEVLHKRKNNTRYPVESHIQLLNYKGNKIFLVISMDITNRKQTESELLKAKERAEESDRLKSIFLSNMSHEIRTPMNAIMGFSGLLADPGLQQEQKIKYVDIIKKSSNRLLNLINDIIDISKLESKQLSVYYTECNICEIINHCTDSLKNSENFKNKKEVEFVINIAPELESLSFSSDPNRIQQVIDNFISNSIKFTHKGYIEVGARIFTRQQGQYLEVYITDTGIGIPEEKQHLIFKRFRQIEEEHYHEGAGIGLSICKGIVELLGGTVDFSSVAGQGSTFSFCLPLVPADHITPPEQNKTDGIDLKGKKILIAEDDLNSFSLLEIILSPAGPEIIHAKNGNELMKLVENQTPDLILLDINMPEKDGYQCLQEIQNMNIRTKIIAQTAYALTDEKEKCIKAGFHGYISKPVSKEDLFKEIDKVMST